MGVTVLLDTHTLLWWLTDDPNLSPKARTLIATSENTVLVSSASAWEISTKYRIGKLPGGEAVAPNLAELVRLERMNTLRFRQLILGQAMTRYEKLLWLR